MIDFDKLDNANEDEQIYSDVEFEDNSIYNEEKTEISKDKKKINKKKNSFSRTMNRLPNHSGPNNRYVDSKNNRNLEMSKEVYRKKLPKKELKRQKQTNHNNTDISINNYNKNLKQELYDSKSISNLELNMDTEDETEYSTNLRHNHECWCLLL